MDADEDQLLRCNVPERYKSAASPIGAVQGYIAELERNLDGALRIAQSHGANMQRLGESFWIIDGAGASDLTVVADLLDLPELPW